MSQFQLMREKRFRPFFFTQFLGAFNDNVFKTALITLVAFRAGQLTELDSGMLVTLLPGLFILPFFIFSATCGQIADKFEKSALTRAVKLFEILIMALASWGFLTNNFYALVAALFLMGVHSTLFGPVKYSYLPQHLRSEELVGGNGLIEMGTFVAILLGEILGAWLATSSSGAIATSLTVFSLAVLGFWVSRGVPHSPASDPDLKINWNPITETWHNLRFAHTNKTVWLALLGTSWFWFYGATVLAQFPNYAKEILHGDESVFILLLAVFSFGIGLGSLLCEKLSGHQVEIGLVPFGAIGLSLFGIDLYFFTLHLVHPPAIHDVWSILREPEYWRGLADIMLIGLFGGFYIVPLYALIQTRSEKSHQSRVIAANNILNALFMVASAGVSLALFKFARLTIPELFLATALFNAVVVVYICRLVPEFFIRFIVWILVHTVYQLKKIGRLPPSGAALVVCNHTSYVDTLILTASCSRPMRFVIDPHFFAKPVLAYMLKAGRAIPLRLDASGERLADETQQQINAALAAGDMVVTFPEQNIDNDGTLRPFAPWVNELIEQAKVPVLPLALSGLWPSAFSRRPTKAMQRLCALHPLRKISAQVGSPLAPEKASAETAQRAVAGLL